MRARRRLAPAVLVGSFSLACGAPLDPPAPEVESTIPRLRDPYRCVQRDLSGPPPRVDLFPGDALRNRRPIPAETLGAPVQGWNNSWVAGKVSVDERGGRACGIPPGRLDADRLRAAEDRYAAIAAEGGAALWEAGVAPTRVGRACLARVVQGLTGQHASALRRVFLGDLGSALQEGRWF